MNQAPRVAASWALKAEKRELSRAAMVEMRVVGVAGVGGGATGAGLWVQAATQINASSAKGKHIGEDAP